MTEPTKQRIARVPEVIADMSAAYYQGASIRAISNQYGYSYCWVRLRLLDAGVQFRGRGGAQPRRTSRTTEGA